MKKLQLILSFLFITNLCFSQIAPTPQTNYSIYSDSTLSDLYPPSINITGVIGKFNKISIYCNDDRTYYKFVGNELFKYKDIRQINQKELTPNIQITDNTQALYFFKERAELPIKSIFLDSIRFSNLSIDIGHEKIEMCIIKNCHIGHILLSGLTDTSHHPYQQMFINSSIDSITYKNSTLKNTLTLQNSNIFNLNFKNCKIKSSLTLKKMLLPKSLLIEDMDFETAQSYLDLTAFENQQGKICKLSLIDCDISRIRLDYTNFKLSFAGDGYSTTDGRKEIIYKQLLDEQKNDGFEDGYEKLAIEYKEYKYQKNPSIFNKFFNLLDRVWWNYGFDTQAIILNSLKIFLLFFVINLFIYETILVKGYPVETFVDANNRLNAAYEKRPVVKIIYRIFHCLIFTGFIFWGIKLDFEKIKLSNIIIPSYIILQYLSGLFCVSYIIHYYFSS